MKKFPIKLTKSGYWQELEHLKNTGILPSELATCLKGVINSHINKTNPPDARPNVIRLAKEHLREGILLSDSTTDELYQLAVFVPFNNEEQKGKSIFLLTPKYPGGQLKYLNDF